MPEGCERRGFSWVGRMARRVVSLWADVPEAGHLKTMLSVARDSHQPLRERQYALSYLSGSAKVLAGLEKRRALAEYLQRQISAIKATLYYSDTGSQPHGR